MAGKLFGIIPNLFRYGQYLFKFRCCTETDTDTELFSLQIYGGDVTFSQETLKLLKFRLFRRKKIILLKEFLANRK